MRHYKKLSAFKVAFALAAFAAASCPLIVHAQATALPQIAELSAGVIALPGGGFASPFAFGAAVAVSGDGNTMVVGTGAGGSITVDDGTLFSPHFTSYRVDFGAIYIFVKQLNGWTQAGVISAPDGTQGFDSFGAETEFGASVAVNYDASVIVVAGPNANSPNMS